MDLDIQENKMQKYSYDDINFYIGEFIEGYKENPSELIVSNRLYSELFQDVTDCHLEYFKGKISTSSEFEYHWICLRGGLISELYCDLSLVPQDTNKCKEIFNGDGTRPVPEKKKGQKFDRGKPRWSLLPFRELKNVVEILTFGADKYAPGNWQKVDNATERYSDAALRHLTSWLSGEKKDPESGKSHLAHVACNILFLMWFENEGENNEVI